MPVPAPTTRTVSARPTAAACSNRAATIGWHQIAAAAKRQIIVDIGDRAQMLGHEQLAPGLGHGGEDPFVGDLVGSDLALDHVRARRFEYRHPATGGQWAAGL